ncbi:MAG: DNA cytosine methyltransferase [Bacteroides sp.]
MKHYLNICNLSGKDLEPVDIITFGSPCQDMSIAGTREGLKHSEQGDDKTTRSGLFYEAVRIIKEMREKTNGRYPTFAIWENVPGAFSSQKGEDFRAVLEELTKVKDSDAAIPRPPKGKWADAGAVLGDGWSIAWRVLDAQFHGIPQRRRRILLVTDFTGERAGEILFECHGLPGYPAESGAPWQGTAGDVAGGTTADDREGGNLTAFHLTQDPISSEEVSPCLSSGNPKNGQATVGICAAYSFDSLSSNSMKSKNPISGCNRVEIAKCLDTAYPCPSKNQGGIAVVQTVPTICLQGNGIDRADTAGCNGRGWTKDVCYTLNTIDRPAVVCLLDDQGGSILSATENATVAPTIMAQMHGNIPAVCLDCRNMVGNTELSATLQAKGDGGFSLNYINPVVVYDARGNGDGAIVPTITGDHEGHISDYTAVAVETFQNTGRGWWNESSVGATIRTACGGDSTKANVVVERVRGGIRYIVRRLTPTECARLQGFSDWWSELPTITGMSDEDYDFWCDVLFELAKIEQTARWDELSGNYMVWREVKPNKKKHETFEPYWLNTGKPYKPKTPPQMVAWYNKLHTDGAEYKMWGNGVALPVVRVPLHEMAKLGAKTLGSLFDGSGGFPLAGLLDGITPLWSSEIEPYPIAVTRARLHHVGTAGMRGGIGGS